QETAPQIIKDLMSHVDIVLSDMAPNASGQTNLDHMRIVTLVEAAFDFACEVLSPGGVFVAKVWQGGAENKLLEKIKKKFKIVKHAKPDSSRKDSAETFLVAMGFREH
ncbi:MAG: RlmE family RNA methyltransferase, partial [Pseudomonadota bacterium]